MNKNEEGFILLDTIIALFILSITLTSVYSLVIRYMQLEDKISVKVDMLLDTGSKYDEEFKKIIK